MAVSREPQSFAFQFGVEYGDHLSGTIATNQTRQTIAADAKYCGGALAKLLKNTFPLEAN